MIDTVVDGKYRVAKKLGQGGMGAVYEAVHVGTGRRVALKVILNAGATKNHEVVARFQREARAAGAIDTQHIVQVFDTGIDPDTTFPYMVMEYLGGEDLAQLVDRVGALPPEAALRIVGQAAAGLQRAHERGVVHRDIKPANLFLSRADDGTVLVKVLDFGIAKVAMDLMTTAENAGLTRTGSMLGSPLYMSPEQAKSAKTLGPQTDVWSLGVVLYEALCGRSPNADAESLGMLILAVCGEPARHIQELAPWVPIDIARIVHKALQIDLSRRYASMQEMHDAIRALCPTGFGVQHDQLRSLPDHIRVQVAPKLVMSSNLQGAGETSIMTQSGGTHSMKPLRDPALTGPPTNPALDPRISGTGPYALPTRNQSGHSVAQTLAAAPPKKSLLVPALVGLVVAVGAASLALTKIQRDAQAKKLESQAPDRAAETAASLQALSMHTSYVAIASDNVEVEVDGHPATVQDGGVPVVGLPGTSHQVRLSRGEQVTVGRVVVTTSDVTEPSRIALEVPLTSVDAGAAHPLTPPAGKSPSTPRTPLGNQGGHPLNPFETRGDKPPAKEDPLRDLSEFDRPTKKKL